MKKHLRHFKKQLLLWLLILSTLLSSLPLTSLPAFAEPTPATEDSETSTSPHVAVTRNGTEIAELTLADDEKVVLTAKATHADGMKFQWQILDRTDSSRWINILGAGENQLDVSYALVGSMLNTTGKTALRCILKDGEDQYASDPVAVTVSFSVPREIVDDGNSASNLLMMANVPVMMAANEEDMTTCSIVINYLFDNNVIAFEPYGASVARGSDFNAAITSPGVVGYAPFRRVGEDYVDASVVELNIESIEDDVIINVIYEPTLVNFSVHHHLQNLSDDEYSVHYDLITTEQALTGTMVPEGLALTEAQLPGFKSLAYERLTVAADGSTVVEIRYDRNYYLIDFDMTGGYGAEPIYTRYGASVGANDPIRHGYVFDGWELISYGGQTPTAEQASKYDINNGHQITVPNANLRYRARWITRDTEYTMVFWRENANDDGYSYWGYLDGLSAMSGTYVSSADRVGEVHGIDDEAYFTYNPTLSDQNVLVEGDGSTVVNVYYTRNHYTITFKAPGLCTIPAGHTHTDNCYELLCDKGHTHTDDCSPRLICTTPEHQAHTDDCLLCGLTEHTHGSACCPLEEHIHTASCWRYLGSQFTPTNAPSHVENGYIISRRSGRWTYHYIHIGGIWYRYTGQKVSEGDIVDPICGSTEHAHSDACCDQPAHIHTDTCYKDILHTHTNTCYQYSCGKIDHTHDDGCYRLTCGTEEGHTHTSTCTNASRTNTVKMVYRKYQQSLEDLWPVTDDNGVTYDDGQCWEPSNSAMFSEVLVYIDNMPPEDFTLTLNTSSNSTYTMNYYLQVLPGDSYTHAYDGNHYILKTTVKANYNYVTRAEDFFDINGYVQFTSDPAFNGNSITISGSDKTVNFYYNRITDHYLRFNNNGTVLNDKTEHGIMYGALLKEFFFVPDYPDNLEPNAYQFAGWYTSSGCFDGTEVDWDTLTMTEGDLMLYANWVPVQHAVRVFVDATLTEQIGETQLVNHKALANAPVATPINGNYIFQGWFYTDTADGQIVEKAFVFNGIPVIDDMDIYAKWSSHVSVDYTIHYVLHETGEPIADPTVGSAIAGHNKTFEAKAGEQLYAGYQTGYYPLTNSHTITMSVDGTHEFTFEYIYVESMPYLVRYVNAETGETVSTEKKVVDNNLSVVTETFVKLAGMMPDAYQKRLVLSAVGGDTNEDGILDSNVITFRYHSDEEHAYYRVVHHIENISGDGYREYRSEETVGEIGATYLVEALTLTGFSFNGALTQINSILTPISGAFVSQTLGAEGMLIELFYDRNDVSYIVKYVESGTGKELQATKTGSGMFGEQILEYAPDLTAKGYTTISDTLKMLALSSNETHNVIEFVYQEAVVSVKYAIVGPDGCGSLGQYSENVLAISGIPRGSLPSPAAGYLFEGWYQDAACTTPVNSLWVDTNNRLTPEKASDAVWTDHVTYYARFIPDHTNLTVKTTGVDAMDSDQAFLFRVTGAPNTQTAHIDLTVSIIGNGSVTVTDLPVGMYTVVELTDWSWRYKNDTPNRSITLTVYADANVVTFENTRTDEQWLDGNSIKVNVFNDPNG